MKNKLLQYALSWNGYLEKKSNAYLEHFTKNAGENNYTIFAKKYNDYFGEDYQGQAWCAMFVSVCFYDIFHTKDIMNPFYYCPNGVSFFKNNERWYNKPQQGDIIFFTNGKRAYHVGIVYKIDSNYVYTIEGNTSDSTGVVENGGCVAKKKYSLKYSKILGYGRPFYEKAEEQINMEELKKLQVLVDELKSQVIVLNQNLNSANKKIEILQKEKDMIYNYVDDNMPEWARSTIQKLVNRGLLKGDGSGLKLDPLMLRILVINDRTGIYENDIIYNYIDDNMPKWARPTIEKLVNKGLLDGNGSELNLNTLMLRILVINDRAGLYD